MSPNISHSGVYESCLDKGWSEHYCTQRERSDRVAQPSSGGQFGHRTASLDLDNIAAKQAFSECMLDKAQDREADNYNPTQDYTINPATDRTNIRNCIKEITQSSTNPDGQNSKAVAWIQHLAQSGGTILGFDNQSDPNKVKTNPFLHSVQQHYEDCGGTAQCEVNTCSQFCGVGESGSACRRYCDLQLRTISDFSSPPVAKTTLSVKSGPDAAKTNPWRESVALSDFEQPSVRPIASKPIFTTTANKPASMSSVMQPHGYAKI